MLLMCRNGFVSCSAPEPIAKYGSGAGAGAWRGGSAPGPCGAVARVRREAPRALNPRWPAPGCGCWPASRSTAAFYGEQSSHTSARHRLLLPLLELLAEPCVGPHDGPGGSNERQRPLVIAPQSCHDKGCRDGATSRDPCPTVNQDPTPPIPRLPVVEPLSYELMGWPEVREELLVLIVI